MRSMRRALRRVLLAICMGAITTVAVAWGCGWLAQPNPRFTEALRVSLAVPGTHVVRGHIGIRRVRGNGFRALVAETTFTPTVLDVRGLANLLDRLEEDEQRLVLDAIRADIGLRAWFVQGWPWPCVSCEYSDGDGAAGGFVITEPVRVNLGVAGATIPRALAWRPYWPGAAINAAIFSLAWWLMLAVPPMVLRTRRRRRGRCAKCGYDLRATDDGRCPECGRCTLANSNRLR